MKAWLSGKTSPGTRLGVLLALVVPLIGCGGPYTGTVSGKVTYKDKPVPNADVFFYHATDGRYAYTRTDNEGNYTCREAPGGPVKVVVATTAPLPIPPPGVSIYGSRPLTKEEYEERKRQRLAYVKIPDRYGKQNSTPLTYNVQKGEQPEPFNIELKDKG